MLPPAGRARNFPNLTGRVRSGHPCPVNKRRHSPTHSPVQAVFTAVALLLPNFQKTNFVNFSYYCVYIYILYIRTRQRIFLFTSSPSGLSWKFEYFETWEGGEIKSDTHSPVSLVRVKFSLWRAPLLSFPAIRRSFRDISSQFTTSSRPGSSTGAAAQPPVLSIAAAVLYLVF